MIHSARKLFVAGVVSVCVTATGFAQSQVPAATSDKGAAYYNFSMGHLYAELASAYGNRGDYYSKAIEHYKQAIKQDPSATFLLEELTELYVQGNQLKAAVQEAEELLKQNPDNLQARRMLGRIYTRSIGDSQQGKINEEMVKRATEQYKIITSKDPKDTDSWLTLGRLYRVSQNSVEAEKAFKKAIENDATNEDALTGLAMVYSDVGDTKNMVETLKRVTDKSPNARTLTTLGSAYEQMRDYPAAAEVFRKALTLAPDNVQVKRALAQNLLYSDKLDEALPLYKELAESEPKEAQHQLRISEIYRQKRDFDKARAALEAAKALDRDSIEIRYDEVNLLDAEGKTDDAIAALQKILDDTAKKTYSNAEKANRGMLLERLGLLYRGARRWDKAVDTLRQIAAMDPAAGPRVSANVVDTYRIAKDMTKALEEAEAARKKYPDDRMVRVVYATLLADLGKVDQGASEVRSLLNKSDKDRETYLTLAQIYEKGKRFGEMEKALGEAEKLSDSPQEKETVYFMRGAMLEKQKKYGAAEAEFRRVIEMNPQSASALNYLGYMLADRNQKLEEALGFIRKALEIDPMNGAYLDSLGWAYYRLDKLDDAEKNLRLSIERVQGDPTVHDHLGDVLIKEGKVKEAIAQWQLSLQEFEKQPQSEADPVEVAKVTKKLESARVRLAKESRQ
jgi:tetratricopeptide (TPR) repeat protein